MFRFWSEAGGAGRAAAEDYSRSLYRDGYLSPDDFEGRLAALQKLRRDELKPVI